MKSQVPRLGGVNENPDVNPTVPDAGDSDAVNSILEATAAGSTREFLDPEEISDAIKAYEGDEFTEKAQEDCGLLEYLQRLKQGKGRYFGNVVHQGVRDHFGKGDHAGGLGEYCNEMHNLMKDGSVKSSVRRLQNDPQFLKKAKEAIIKIMNEKKLSASEAFDEFAYGEFYADAERHQQLEDKMAVHFSSNAILDAYYGTETDNESFIILPESLALMDRQYWSRAVDTAFSRDTIYNDVYVWPEKGEPAEIATNGGIFFVPRGNTVDAESGSKYLVQDGKAVLDIEKLESSLGQDSHYPDLIAEKTSLESMFMGEELEEVEKYLMAVLTNSDLTDIGLALDCFFDVTKLREGFRHIPEETLKRAGFKTDLLKKMFSDGAGKAAILGFTEKYPNVYTDLANSKDGKFYKTSAEAIDSKSHYDNFIKQKLKNVEIREIQGDKQDIVEYRGLDQDGRKRIFRVVFYSNSYPNKAVREFYNSLGIEFDSSVIDDTKDEAAKARRAKKRTTFEEVKYRYDFDQLRHNVLAQMAS